MRIADFPLVQAVASNSAAAPTTPAADISALCVRVEELTRERDQLLTVVDVMQELT
jgi:hypothetical protein